MAVARLALTSFADGEVRLSDEVELYQRTYTTLLRSSGETQLRVLESSHRAMGSSLHPLAASEELDLGAFLYAIQRLPDGIIGAQLVVMGQDAEALTASGIPIDSWQEAEAPARRRRWYDSGVGTLAVLLASASDVDDLVPTLVALQIEWNKIRVRMRAAGWPDAATSADVPPEECARELGGERRGLGAPAARLGRLVRRADAADRRAAAGAAGADARRLAHRLRAPDPALVDAGQRRARPRRPDRAAALLRELEHPQPRQHRHRHRARARGRARELRRAAARRRHPARGAGPVSRGTQPGVVGQLPVLRRASVLPGPRRRGLERAPQRRAAAGRHPPEQQDGAARARRRSSHSPRSNPVGSIRGLATSTPRRWPAAAR